MPTARSWAKSLLFQGKIWVIGGKDDSSSLNVVEVYDVMTDSWMSGVPSNTARGGCMAWVAKDRIYLAGGYNGSYLHSIEVYNPATMYTLLFKVTASAWCFFSGIKPTVLH